MKAQILLRKVHHWGSLIVMLPLGVMIIAGLFLMLKKELAWIQPPTQSGIERQATPRMAIDKLFQIAKTVPELEVSDWRELSRVDIKPGKGTAKFIGQNNWEVQLDTHTGEVLQIAYRRSDMIEALHDGSFFADWVKLYVFFPAGIILFVLWGTGIYLFALPHYKRWQKHRRRASQLAQAE